MAASRQTNATPAVIFHAFPVGRQTEPAPKPLAALAARIEGTKGSLPWFLRAEAVASLTQDDDGRGGAKGFEVKEAVRQFFVGGRGGGAPAHPHSHAANSLAFGTKIWRMWPPQHSHFSAKSAWLGWDVEVGLDKVLECTQRGGDVMYVPASWGHSVINVQDTVGVTTEFDLMREGEEL